MPFRCPRLTPLLVAMTLFSAAIAPSEVFAQNQNRPKSLGVSLSIQDFLSQVRSGNKSFAGSERSVEGAELRTEESSLLTKPALIGSVQSISDQRETGNPLLGDETQVQSYSLGVRQQTTFGLDARLLYNFSETSLPQATMPEKTFFGAGPVLELTQALGRNGWGRETRATKELLQAQVQATKYGESFRQKQILAEAERVYWRLAVAREAVEATRETVKRAERLRQLSQRRAKLNLGNRTDYLQTEAAFLSRTLELQTALDEEENASRALNTLRGLDSDEVSESIAPLDGKVIGNLTIPERSGLREDVLAAEQQKRLAEANSHLGVEKNKPSVNLVGTLGLNGRDPASGEAISESTTTDHPNYAIGLRLDIPFDIGTQSDAREGYRREELAAQLNFEQKRFEGDRLWKDLSLQFRDSVARYHLAQKIEAAQQEKLSFERTRHQRGLATIFQVLQFEQDYANSQLARIRAQADILNIYAQLKTFGGSK